MLASDAGSVTQAVARVQIGETVTAKVELQRVTRGHARWATTLSVTADNSIAIEGTALCHLPRAKRE